MPNSKHHRYNQRKKGRYNTESFGKSIFDDNPTLTINRYRVPNAYKTAVSDVIKAFKHDISFNKAVDQVAALDPEHINRNKLAEHALKWIANQY